MTVLEGPIREGPIEEAGWAGLWCKAGSGATARWPKGAPVGYSDGPTARGSEGATAVYDSVVLQLSP